jgi:hypothetical protein
MSDTSSALSNDDLIPSPPGERDWVWGHYTFLWLGMVICIPAYLLAGGLMDQGLSPLAAIAAILLGNLIVLIPMALIGHAGARYGIPFAVLARASFGTSGAKIAAFARAIVACGWYGIQTWVGGNTLLVLGRRIGLGDLKGPLAGGGHFGVRTARIPAVLGAATAGGHQGHARSAPVRDMDRPGQGRPAAGAVRLGDRSAGRNRRHGFADHHGRGVRQAASRSGRCSCRG